MRRSPPPGHRAHRAAGPLRARPGLAARAPLRRRHPPLLPALGRGDRLLRAVPRNRSPPRHRRGGNLHGRPDHLPRLLLLLVRHAAGPRGVDPAPGPRRDRPLRRGAHRLRGGAKHGPRVPLPTRPRGGRRRLRRLLLPRHRPALSPRAPRRRERPHLPADGRIPVRGALVFGWAGGRFGFSAAYLAAGACSLAAIPLILLARDDYRYATEEPCASPYTNPRRCAILRS